MSWHLAIISIQSGSRVAWHMHGIEVSGLTATTCLSVTRTIHHGRMLTWSTSRFKMPRIMLIVMSAGTSLNSTRLPIIILIIKFSF
jgi:hypothetical protein